MPTYLDSQGNPIQTQSGGPPPGLPVYLDDNGNPKSSTATQPSALSRFGSGLYSATLAPIVHILTTNPIDTAVDLFKGAVGTEDLKAIKKAAQSGDITGAAALTVHYLDKKAHPMDAMRDAMSDDIQSSVKQGDYAGAGGKALGYIASLASPILGESDTAAALGEAVKTGVKVAAPDMAAGALKAGAGAAMAEVLPGGPLKYAIGAAPAYSGGRQIMRGIGAGFDAGKLTYTAERTAQAARDAAPAVPIVETAAQATAPGAGAASPAERVATSTSASPLLDEKAKLFGFKDYADAAKDPEAQKAIYQLADAARNAPPVIPPSPRAIEPAAAQASTQNLIRGTKDAQTALGILGFSDEAPKGIVPGASKEISLTTEPRVADRSYPVSFQIDPKAVPNPKPFDMWNGPSDPRFESEIRTPDAIPPSAITAVRINDSIPLSPADLKTITARAQQLGIPVEHVGSSQPSIHPAEIAARAFPEAGPVTSGLKVRGSIPNLSSIDSSLNDPEELPGVREVPMSAFPGAIEPGGKIDLRTSKLATEIQHNGEINPLIVAVDHEGPYILEGGHRFDALGHLGKTTFPAKVVLDRELLDRATSSTQPSVAAQPAVVPPANAVARNGAPVAEQLRDALAPGAKADARGVVTIAPNGEVEAPDPEALKMAMRDLPVGAPKAIAKANYAGNQEPAQAAAVYDAAGRANKAQILSTMLHDEGITAQKVSKWSADAWLKAAQDRGLLDKHQPFSVASQGEVIDALKRLEGKIR